MTLPLKAKPAEREPIPAAQEGMGEREEGHIGRERARERDHLGDITCSFPRAERWGLVAAVAGGAAAAALGWIHPAGVVPAWRLAVFACLQPALGSLIFILIYRLAGGQWMVGLAPFLLSGTRLLPWIWILVLPLLIVPPAAPARGGPGPSSAAEASVRRPGEIGRPATLALEEAFSQSTERHAGGQLALYFRRPFFISRALFYGLLFFLLSAGAKRALRAPRKLAMTWFGPLGMIGLVFTLLILATDWFILLDPGWYSTGFPLVWTVSQALSGLGVAVAAALAAGADPGHRGRTTQKWGLDWGNLLLASTMAFSYVTFVQFLIIWSGNLPAEIQWYNHRKYGAWHVLLLGFFLLAFVIPFFLLLSRFLKQRRGGLGAIAGISVAGQLTYTAWLIAPAYGRYGAAGAFLLAAMLVAGGGLFLNRYLAGARRAALYLA